MMSKKETLELLDDEGYSEEEKKEALEWVDRAEKEFQRLAKTTGFPMETIYRLYSVFGQFQSPEEDEHGGEG